MTDRFWDRTRRSDEKDKTESVRIIGAEEAAEAIERGEVSPRRAEGELRFGDRPAAPPSDAQPVVRFPLPADESEALSRPRPVTPLPHWSEPPTGEVPRAVVDTGEDGDDLDAWSTFATSGPRWRDQAGDWQDADYDPDGLGHDEEMRVGALDTSDRPAPDDFFGFAAAETAAAPEAPRRPRPAAAPTGSAPSARPRRPMGAVPSSGGRDMQLAIITGAALALIALASFSIGPGAAMVLVTAVIVLSAAELFSALQRAGYQPATLLGLVACGGLSLAAYWRGSAAVPLVVGLAVVFTMLWFLIAMPTQHPTMNAGVTLLGIGQVGVLGSFAALILTMPNGNGVGILIGVIVAVAANDIGALVVGQMMGRAPLAAEVSPNKTIEGVVGGAAASIIATIIFLGIFGLDPWTTWSAILLGVSVAVLAPLGDLCESMLKRDLGVKDMGTLLPGHGGLYDRFDGLLFALPAAFYIAQVMELGL